MRTNPRPQCQPQLYEYRGRQVSLDGALRIAGAGVTKDAARRRIDRGWPFRAAVKTRMRAQYRRRSYGGDGRSGG